MKLADKGQTFIKSIVSSVGKTGGKYWREISYTIDRSLRDITTLWAN